MAKKSERESTRTGPLDKAVGQAIARIREQERWSQDDLAFTARHYGIEWGRSTVAAIENGTRPVGFGELLRLAQMLTRPLSAFVSDEYDEVEVGPLVFPYKHLRGLLSGEEPRHGPRLNPVDTPELRARLREAEQKAARRLGVDHADFLVAWSRLPYGRSFTDERDSRVADRVPPGGIDARGLAALRGHAARELLAEMEPVVEQMKKERGK